MFKMNCDLCLSDVLSPGFSADVSADGTQHELVLKALTPETQYGVYVEAATLTGRSKSQESFFKTQKLGEEALSLLWNVPRLLWIH